MTAGSERSASITPDRTRCSSALQALFECVLRRILVQGAVPTAPCARVQCTTDIGRNSHGRLSPVSHGTTRSPVQPFGQAGKRLFKVVLLMFTSFLVNDFYPCHNVKKDFCWNNLKMTLSSFFDIFHVFFLLEKSTFFCSLYQITHFRTVFWFMHIFSNSFISHFRFFTVSI